MRKCLNCLKRRGFEKFNHFLNFVHFLWGLLLNGLTGAFLKTLKQYAVCSSNSLGTSHSRQGWDDSSSSSPAVVFYIGTKWLLLLHSSLSLSLMEMGGVRYFCSSLFCDKMITSGWILEFKVSIRPYWSVHFDAGK